MRQLFPKLTALEVNDAKVISRLYYKGTVARLFNTANVVIIKKYWSEITREDATYHHRFILRY